jgi:hypothetical protein
MPNVNERIKTLEEDIRGLEDIIKKYPKDKEGVLMAQKRIETKQKDLAGLNKALKYGRDSAREALRRRELKKAEIREYGMTAAELYKKDDEERKIREKEEMKAIKKDLLQIKLNKMLKDKLSKMPAHQRTIFAKIDDKKGGIDNV